MPRDSGSAKPLTPQDASFVRLDRLQLPMQVAVVAMFDGGTWLDAGVFDLERFRDYLGSRLGDVPEFHSRVGVAPKTGEPAWSRVAALDLGEHVKLLPADGSVEARVDSFLSERLDRGSPLWEIGVIPEVEGVDTFGIVWKVHHALVDGVAGIEFLRGVLQPKYGSTGLSGLDRGGQETGVGARRTKPNGKNGLLGSGGPNLRAVAEGLTRTTASPLTEPVLANLASQWFQVDRKELRLIRRRTAVTTNAILLAALTGGLRNLIRRWGRDPAAMRLRVEVPVATQRRRTNGELGNRLGIMLIPLPVWEESPERRLILIDSELQTRQRERWHVDFELLARLLALAPSLMSRVYAGIMTHIRPHNLVFSSIPGPVGALTMRDAELTALYPLIPPMHGHALGVATISYRGRIHWGIRSALSDATDADCLAQGIVESLKELR